MKRKTRMQGREERKENDGLFESVLDLVGSLQTVSLFSSTVSSFSIYPEHESLSRSSLFYFIIC